MGVKKIFLFWFFGHGFWVNIEKIQRYVVKIQVEKIRVCGVVNLVDNLVV